MIKTADGHVKVMGNSPAVVALHQLAEKLNRLPDATIDVQIGMEDAYRIWASVRFIAYAQIEGAALANMATVNAAALEALVDHEMEKIREGMVAALVAYARENVGKP